MVGAAAGAAMVGMRPVVDMLIAPFLYVAMDQVVSIIAKFADLGLAEGRVVRVGDLGVPMREAHYVLRPDTGRQPTPEAVAFVRWLDEQHHGE